MDYRIEKKEAFAVLGSAGTFPYEGAKQTIPQFWQAHVAAGYCVEMYADPREFSKGTLDEKYYSEIWIPVKKK